MRPRAALDRRWCLPTTIVRSPGESLWGGAILNELDCDLGMVLWSVARDVDLWTSAPAAVRLELFAGCNSATCAASDAVVPVELKRPLETLSDELTRAGVDMQSVAICCLEITAWARQTRHPHTALVYAQLGALAAPELSEAALQTAICAVDLGEQARAETWLRRAVSVARREPDLVVYATAYALLGDLCLQQGRIALAEGYFLKAVRAGRRFPVPSARRDGGYGLFRIAIQRNDKPAAKRFAQAIRRASLYEREPVTQQMLDLARFWTDEGCPGRARPMLRRLVSQADTLGPAEALAVTALTARLTARKQPRRSRAADKRVWELLPEASALGDAVTLAAVLDLAHGAALRGDRSSFGRAARAALRLASPELSASTQTVISDLSRVLSADRPVRPKRRLKKRKHKP
jgi:hypothetical protein